MSPPEKPFEPVELSIGTLSNATGVPVETLRTWERRYGFPTPIMRTGGSHRRYAAETIGVVQLIVRALDLGYRPSAVVGRDPEELRRLLSGASSEPLSQRDAAARDRLGLQRWVELTRAFDGEGLTAEFHQSLAEMAAIEFLERCMGPYLVEIGELWARGTLRVSHEHFASEKAREFLSTQWRRLSDAVRPGRPKVVLATPPRESHVLGLHMAAWVVACADAEVVFLGADTPMIEVAFAAERYGARGVVISIAAGYAGDLEAQARELAERLPPDISVAIGGAGGRVNVTSVAQYLNGFQDLLRWANALAVDHGGGVVPLRNMSG